MPRPKEMNQAQKALARLGVLDPKTCQRVRPVFRHKKRKNQVAREIKRMVMHTGLVLPGAPFRRLAREVAQQYNSDIRWKKEAFEAVQSVVEERMTMFFHSMKCAAAQAKRDTIGPKDINFVKLMEQAATL